jgi:hypothetical protein
VNIGGGDKKTLFSCRTVAGDDPVNETDPTGLMTCAQAQYTSPDAAYTCLAVVHNVTGSHIWIRQGSRNAGFGLSHAVSHGIDLDGIEVSLHYAALLPAKNNMGFSQYYEYLPFGIDDTLYVVYLVDFADRISSTKKPTPDTDQIGLVSAYCADSYGTLNGGDCPPGTNQTLINSKSGQHKPRVSRGRSMLESESVTLNKTVDLIVEKFMGRPRQSRTSRREQAPTPDAVFSGSAHVQFVDVGVIDGLLVIVFDSPAAGGARFAYLESLDGLVREFPDDPEAIATLVFVHLEELVAGARWFESPRIVTLAEYRLFWPTWQT